MAERNNDLKYLNDIQPIDMSSEDLMNLMGLANDIINQQKNNKTNVVYTIFEFYPAYYGNTVDGLIELLNSYKQNHPNEDLFHSINSEFDDDGDVRCKHEIWSKRLETDEEHNKRMERNQPNLRKPMDLIKASELVLQELSNMTDEDLVLALEACEDNSIGYAVCSEENKS